MEYKVKETRACDLKIGDDYQNHDKDFVKITGIKTDHADDELIIEFDGGEEYCDQFAKYLVKPFVRLETKDKVSPVSYKDFQFKAYIPSLEITLDRLALYPDGNIGVDADYFSAMIKESPLKLEWYGEEEVYQYDEKEEAYSTVALSVLNGDDWLWIEPSDYQILLPEKKGYKMGSENQDPIKVDREEIIIIAHKAYNKWFNNPGADKRATGIIAMIDALISSGHIQTKIVPMRIEKTEWISVDDSILPIRIEESSDKRFTKPVFVTNGKRIEKAIYYPKKFAICEWEDLDEDDFEGYGVELIDGEYWLEEGWWNEFEDKHGTLMQSKLEGITHWQPIPEAPIQ